MVLRNWIFIGFATIFASGVHAQSDQVLAAVRAELSALMLELNTLRDELSAVPEGEAAAPLGANVSQPDDLLERVDALEAELRSLTGRLERQGFEINQRLSAAEARLSSLSNVLEIRDGLGPVQTQEERSTPFPMRVEDSVPLTQQERADYVRIETLYEALSYDEVVVRSEVFVQTYPGGPLTLDVMLRKAQALAAAERWQASADAYFDLFSEAGENDIGSRALMGLGDAFQRLGQKEDACRSYTQVGDLYPSSAAVIQADQARKDLNCPR
ncbi:MAG: hypothetical protein AAGA63_08160 [Pseudomonadota bacterium]